MGRIPPETEQKLWAAVGASRLTDVNGFPFPSHAALAAAVQSGDAQLGIEYAAARNSANITKGPVALFVILLLSLVKPALVVVSVILAFATGHWSTLGGAPSAFLGHLLANPYRPAKPVARVLVAAAVVHVALARTLIGFSWISFALATSAIALWTLNALAWSWARDAILASEAVAAAFFKGRDLHIRTRDGQIHDAQIS